MPISRRLPQSDAARDKALTQAKSKNDSIPAANQFLTAPTISRLDVIQPDYKVALQKRGNALAAQVGATAGVAQTFVNARTYVSHFFQVFNLGVARGKYTPQQRAFFQLDVSSDSVPPLTSHQDLALWGERINTGDDARVGAGGLSMDNPRTSEVNAAVDEFNAKNANQSSLKDEYDNQQENVANLHEEADRVIKKVWDEVDTFYNEEENSSKRRKCREWGVIYISDVELTFNLMAIDDTTNIGIDNATILLVETGTTVSTLNGGAAVVKSTIVDEATFRFTDPNYKPKDMLVELSTGVTVFDVTAMMTPL
ncbi:hypothetical protein [Flavobacterium capsici]|uniref:Uncharacterized protein n=1 Tax=Flavobacterium capsici TaxID=3075618 RepID=A0AA96J9U6_9FLAO|nr:MULTISPECIES: hypothetical protein [unclassified Flavobacterium]WNM19520.1 hypothetical protein RN608_02280 [Flavobacterium sp. PMR2A8]WNM20909.1 hypothetical protein RN605_09450 [Flavobacterium sp. PMTSA4]